MTLFAQTVTESEQLVEEGSTPSRRSIKNNKERQSTRMGMYASGHLRYGIVIPTWEPQEELQDEDGDIIGDDWDYFFEVKTGNSAYRGSPVEISYMDDYSEEQVVFVTVSGFTADSEPQEVDADLLTVKPEWDEQIRTFCEIMGIEYAQPKWFAWAAYG